MCHTHPFPPGPHLPSVPSNAHPHARAVGWLQLSRFEERLHAARTQRAGDEGAASQRPAHELQSLHRAAHEAALQDRRQPSAAQLCAAVLEAAGILPDSEGRRVGVGGALAVEDGRAVMQAEAEGREGAVAAAAVAHLQSRRKLYDAMEASLLEKGLALGGCCVLVTEAGA